MKVCLRRYFIFFSVDKGADHEVPPPPRRVHCISERQAIRSIQKPSTSVPFIDPILKLVDVSMNTLNIDVMRELLPWLELKRLVLA